MIPVARETLNNPMLTFLVYTAALVFFSKPATAVGARTIGDRIIRTSCQHILTLAARTWDNHHGVKGLKAFQRDVTAQLVHGDCEKGELPKSTRALRS